MTSNRPNKCMGLYVTETINFNLQHVELTCLGNI
jgi:hypothetical protein